METLFSGLGTSQKKVNTNREEVRNVIRVLLRSLDYMADNPSETKAIIQKHLRGVDTATVNHIYDVVVKNATRSGIPSKKALENSLLGTPFEGKPLDFDKFVDFSIAREAIP
jgi:ABC-type nitrate/sulfonate/bicarbonate transport system substrate-binding protein